MSQKAEVPSASPRLHATSSGCVRARLGGSRFILGRAVFFLRVGLSVGEKPHIFRAPAHKQQGRADHQRECQQAEDDPCAAPPRVENERGRRHGHAHFRQAVAHAGESEGATAHAHEPLGNGYIHHHRAHERVARTDQDPANHRKLPKISRLTKQEKTHSRDQTAGGDEPPAAVAVQESANHRRRRRADQDLSGANERENAAGNSQVLRERFEKDA